MPYANSVPTWRVEILALCKESSNVSATNVESFMCHHAHYLCKGGWNQNYWIYSTSIWNGLILHCSNYVGLCSSLWEKLHFVYVTDDMIMIKSDPIMWCYYRQEARLMFIFELLRVLWYNQVIREVFLMRPDRNCGRFLVDRISGGGMDVSF